MNKKYANPFFSKNFDCEICIIKLVMGGSPLSAVTCFSFIVLNHMFHKKTPTDIYNHCDDTAVGLIWI